MRENEEEKKKAAGPIATLVRNWNPNLLMWMWPEEQALKKEKKKETHLLIMFLSEDLMFPLKAGII